ncbi:uncharacterized protein LOC128883795 isoform X3 [Hylaeus volcanicus]|uniref:uncharacterized protein LOC128883795 isoform X3 n=1 Tax=Hylaeus volcanicus TaxID=313075 RepID=UPI0023B779BD|nr:uncharacterized protein LOC128883795 isoform X3 [Hylaeus volcanicus]
MGKENTKILLKTFRYNYLSKYEQVCELDTEAFNQNLDVSCFTNKIPKSSLKSGLEKKNKPELQLIVRDFAGELTTKFKQQGDKRKCDVFALSCCNGDGAIPFSPLEFDMVSCSSKEKRNTEGEAVYELTAQKKTSIENHFSMYGNNSSKIAQFFSGHHISHLLGLGTQTQYDALRNCQSFTQLNGTYTRKSSGGGRTSCDSKASFSIADSHLSTKYFELQSASPCVNSQDELPDYIRMRNDFEAFNNKTSLVKPFDSNYEKNLIITKNEKVTLHSLNMALSQSRKINNFKESGANMPTNSSSIVTERSKYLPLSSPRLCSKETKKWLQSPLEASKINSLSESSLKNYSNAANCSNRSKTLSESKKQNRSSLNTVKLSSSSLKWPQIHLSQSFYPNQNYESYGNATSNIKENVLKDKKTVDNMRNGINKSFCTPLKKKKMKLLNDSLNSQKNPNGALQQKMGTHSPYKEKLLLSSDMSNIFLKHLNKQATSKSHPHFDKKERKVTKKNTQSTRREQVNIKQIPKNSSSVVNKKYDVDDRHQDIILKQNMLGRYTHQKENTILERYLSNTVKKKDFKQKSNDLLKNVNNISAHKTAVYKSPCIEERSTFLKESTRNFLKNRPTKIISSHFESDSLHIISPSTSLLQGSKSPKENKMNPFHRNSFLPFYAKIGDKQETFQGPPFRKYDSFLNESLEKPFSTEFNSSNSKSTHIPTATQSKLSRAKLSVTNKNFLSSTVCSRNASNLKSSTVHQPKVPQTFNDKNQIKLSNAAKTFPGARKNYTVKLHQNYSAQPNDSARDPIFKNHRISHSNGLQSSENIISIPTLRLSENFRGSVSARETSITSRQSTRSLTRGFSKLIGKARETVFRRDQPVTARTSNCLTSSSCLRHCKFPLNRFYATDTVKVCKDSK